MISPKVPGPEETLAQLAPLIPPLDRSIEAAIQEARSFFDGREVNVDPFLFPCLVRYHAKLLLEEVGQTADYELDDLANNGLYLRFAGYQIRILKSDNGKLPVPGPSKPKQEFYNQQLKFDFMEAESSQPPAMPAEPCHSVGCKWSQQLGEVNSCMSQGWFYNSGFGRTTLGNPYSASGGTIRAHTSDPGRGFGNHAEISS